jgi:hypothetical protein
MSQWDKGREGLSRLLSPIDICLSNLDASAELTSLEGMVVIGDDAEQRDFARLRPAPPKGCRHCQVT